MFIIHFLILFCELKVVGTAGTANGVVWLLLAFRNSRKCNCWLVSNNVCMFLLCVCMCSTDTPWVFWKLVIGSIPAIFGLPFFIAGASLYSKLLPNSVQGLSNEGIFCFTDRHNIYIGFGQGLRRSVGSLAAIIGPLWVGSTVSFGNYYLMYGVPSGLLVATAVK